MTAPFLTPSRRLLGLALAAGIAVLPEQAAAALLADPSDTIAPYTGSTETFKALRVFPENLVFDVSWGVLGVGQATLKVREVVLMNGRPAYELVSEATSNKFCDGFYKVRDLNKAWLDARTLTSLGYKKQLREGTFFRDEWVLYDPEKLTFDARKVNKDGTFEVFKGTIPANVHDVLSAIYYLRSQQKLEPGTEFVVDVNTRQNWPLVMRVVKRMRINTPAGSFKTVLVEPALRQEGIFIQKGKKLQVWVTDDERKMPVLMKVEVFFGHITARLSKVLQ